MTLAPLLTYVHRAWTNVLGDRVPTSMWIALRAPTRLRDVTSYLGGAVQRCWYMDTESAPAERPAPECEHFLDGGLGGALSGIGRRLEIEDDVAVVRAVVWGM